MHRELKLIVAVAFILALLSGGRVRATDTITFDSVWWNGLSSDEQTYAVQSAVDSYTDGVTEGQIRYALSMYARSNRLAGSTKTTVEASAVFLAAKEYKPTFALFSKTFGTYMHGIDDFYANHPEATAATIGEIMGCLSDKPRQTCDELAKDVSKR